MTRSEEILWRFLRNRRLNGYKFRRQHCLNGYIVDFYCSEYNLAVELDGGIHSIKDIREYDSIRTTYLKKIRINLIRFKNHEVFENTEIVLQKISTYIENLKQGILTP